jgi:hypothetical protein
MYNWHISTPRSRRSMCVVHEIRSTDCTDCTVHTCDNPTIGYTHNTESISATPWCIQYIQIPILQPLKRCSMRVASTILQQGSVPTQLSSPNPDPTSVGSHIIPVPGLSTGNHIPHYYRKSCTQIQSLFISFLAPPLAFLHFRCHYCVQVRQHNASI